MLRAGITSSLGTADVPAGESSWQPCAMLGGVWRTLSKALRGVRVGHPLGFVKIEKRGRSVRVCKKFPPKWRQAFLLRLQGFVWVT